MDFQPLTVRVATADDDNGLRRLAELDSATVPPPPLLIAEVDDRPVAAVSLSTGAAIADPFRPTAEVVALLRLRSRSLGAAAPRRRVLLLPLRRGLQRLRSSPAAQ